MAPVTCGSIQNGPLRNQDSDRFPCARDQTPPSRTIHVSSYHSPSYPLSEAKRMGCQRLWASFRPNGLEDQKASKVVGSAASASQLVILSLPTLVYNIYRLRKICPACSKAPATNVTKGSRYKNCYASIECNLQSDRTSRFAGLKASGMTRLRPGIFGRWADNESIDGIYWISSCVQFDVE